MLVTTKTLTSVAFMGHDQQFRHQTRIKRNHPCILINACNSINAHQRNKPVENWDRVKFSEVNELPNKFMTCLLPFQ